MMAWWLCSRMSASGEFTNINLILTKWRQVFIFFFSWYHYNSEIFPSHFGGNKLPMGHIQVLQLVLSKSKAFHISYMPQRSVNIQMFVQSFLFHFNFFLSQDPILFYFQCFHDTCSTMQLVLDSQLFFLFNGLVGWLGFYIEVVE